MAQIDSPRSIRPGEELSIETLGPYLEDKLQIEKNTLQIEQFPKGHSNLTYLLHANDKEWVLRRPPFGSTVKSAHDMGREYRILSRLSAVYSRAPKPVLYCEDTSIIGAEFYLMERVRGIILRKEPPKGVVLDETIMEKLCESLVDTLVELHTLDYEKADLGSLGKPEGYVTRQIKGWTKRYQNARTDDISQMEEASDWLAKNIPTSGAPALIHNDFKFDNLVLDPNDPTKIIAILDWEMATLGDPLMDLGTTLCYWVQPDDDPLLQTMRFGPTHLPGCYTRKQIIDRYQEKSGFDLTHMNFYFCFGLFKTAVVAQQIYYRYHKGLTKDPRFAMMIEGVRVLSKEAKKRIDNPSF